MYHNNEIRPTSFDHEGVHGELGHLFPEHYISGLINIESDSNRKKK
jgi:hypothetical protein